MPSNYPPPPQELIDADAQHSFYDARLGAGEAKKFLPYLKESRQYLEARLAQEGETIKSRTRLNIMLADINKQLEEIYGEYVKQLEIDFIEIAGDENEFTAESVSAVVAEDYEAVVPAPSQTYAAAMSSPMDLDVKGAGVKLKTLMKNFPKNEAKAINGVIRKGFNYGETTAQIARKIIGTKSKNYKDGKQNMTRAHAFTMAKTGVTQLSQTARHQFAKENEDLVIGYQIVSTLDVHTTQKCRNEGGEIYLYANKYNPKPPFHYGCRTTTTYVFNPKYNYTRARATRPSVGSDGVEQVGATKSSYGWLKDQSFEFQEEALGKERALIFNNAGLSTSEYKEAMSDQFNNPLTIDEARKKNAKINNYLKSLEASR